MSRKETGQGDQRDREKLLATSTFNIQIVDKRFVRWFSEQKHYMAKPCHVCSNLKTHMVEGEH